MDPDLPLTRLRVHNPQTVFSLFPFSTQRLDSLRYIARLHIHRILNRITFHTAPTVSVTIGIYRWRQRDGLQSQMKAEKSERGRVCVLRASTIPLLASIRHSRLLLSSPSRATRQADPLPSP